MCRSSASIWLVAAILLLDAPFARAASDPKSISISGRVVDTERKPVASAVVTLEQRYGGNPQTVVATTDTDGAFQASLAIDQEVLPNIRVQAVSDDQQMLGYFRFPWETRKGEVPKVEIKLERTKSLRIKVVDGQHKLIAGARASLQLDYPVVLSSVLSDKEGIASFRVPVSERIEAALAWKDHMGLDYRVYKLPRGREADTNAKVPEYPSDGLLTLTLDGVDPLTVIVTDDQKKPLAGVQISPWLLVKESEPDSLNLSYFSSEFSQTSDEAGAVTFSWIPEWNKQGITVWPTTKDFVHSRGEYDPIANGSGRLHLTLQRLVPIRGRVTQPDGTPQAGITVNARGAGYTWDDHSGTTTTDNDGRYELLVAPEQVYVVVVSDNQWVSSARDGFAVHPNTPVENKDFVLRSATRVMGRLLNKKTMQAIQGKQVLIYQYGQDLHSLKDVKIANPESSNRYVRPMVFHSATTNDKGEFQFSLGNGNFSLRAPGLGKAQEFSIDGEAERTIDILGELIEEVEFTALITDQSGKPLVGASVESVARSFRHRDWIAKTGEDGKFTVKRREELTVVHVYSSDKTLSAIAEIAADKKSMVLKLDPVGSAHGRLLAEDGQTPASKVEIFYGVQVSDENERTFSYLFGGRVVSAEDGSFDLPHLVQGHEYRLYLESRKDGSIPNLTQVTVKQSEVVDLGTLKIPPPPKPYTKPTLEEQIAEAFGVNGTPSERFIRAIELTELVNQHLLIVFGNPENNRIRKLMDIRYNDGEFRSFVDEYRVIAIPTDQQRLVAAKELATTIDESLGDGRGDFLLVVCDRAGTKLAVVDGDRLSDGAQLSKEKLFAFLGRFKTEPLDARQLLAETLKRANQENKRVIVQETATWCGPCHMLARFLSKNRSWEKDYLWVKMDHRWTGAQELMAEIRDGADGGIPWFAILDSNGKVLITSNQPKSGKNIGYPSDTGSQAHFAHMLNSTRQRMTEEEIGQLIGMWKGS